MVKTFAGCLGIAVAFAAAAAMADDLPPVESIPGAKPRNIVFILTDDHRYDALGFAGHPFLETPRMDELARRGVHLRNAFVTTSLCSPSRASILTGRYMHNHGVMDNNNPAPEGTIFFPQYLQQAGYQTAFIGKWHMGGASDAPRPGFDRWVSFRGQGHYPPEGPRGQQWTLNIDGERVKRDGYVTDELTEYAVDWLDQTSRDEPFFLYLSHKAVHADFTPAERHQDLYADVEIPEPETQADTPENYQGKPMWVKNQRNSWHGVDFPYHSRLDVKEYYRRYCQTLAAVDDSVGRVVDWLDENGLTDETLVIYMGDNGFLFGEHGLIDKRNAYEESMRVPMIALAPGLLPEGETSDAVVANIDIGPTCLAAAGLSTPEQMDGANFLPVVAGDEPLERWRDGLLYEYYWEWNFPHTPTMFALRTGQFKFITYLGVWDTDELYDLEADPLEQRNLIREPEHRETAEQLRRELWRQLEATDGMQIPLSPKRGDGANLRSADGSEAAEFPPHVIVDQE